MSLRSDGTSFDMMGSNITIVKQTPPSTSEDCSYWAINKIETHITFLKYL